MVLAVKTVEYLSAGLPVLTNKYCGGAAYLLEKNNVGIDYNPINFSELTEKNIRLLLNYKTIFNCIQIAKDNFDYKVNAMKYTQIYTELLLKNK